MKIWEMVGLWHYPIPGFFLLAQFCLGILVALGNLVNNSVFLCLSDEGGQTSNDYSSVKGNRVIPVSLKLSPLQLSILFFLAKLTPLKFI